MDSSWYERWRRQRRPLIAVVGCGAAAAILLTLDFPGARLLAGVPLLVAVGSLFAISHRLRNWTPSDPHTHRRHPRP